MPRIVWILPIAAGLLVAVSAWKLTRPPSPRITSRTDASLVRRAPTFQVFDIQNQPVRLEQRYIGRTKMMVVFFQAKDSFADSPVLQEVRSHFETLYQGRPAIIAIGTSQSGIYRRWLAAEKTPLPFPVFSDVLTQVHLAWGAARPRTPDDVDDPTKTSIDDSQVPVEAVFIVDRAGWIRHSHVGTNLGTAEQWARELRQLW